MIKGLDDVPLENRAVTKEELRKFAPRADDILVHEDRDEYTEFHIVNGANIEYYMLRSGPNTFWTLVSKQKRNGCTDIVLKTTKSITNGDEQ